MLLGFVVSEFLHFPGNEQSCFDFFFLSKNEDNCLFWNEKHQRNIYFVFIMLLDCKNTICDINYTYYNVHPLIGECLYTCLDMTIYGTKLEI